MINSVLVAEVNPVQREAIVDLLERSGYYVTNAGDGKELLDYLEDGGILPDVILLGSLIPVVDGATACRTIRAKSWVPILMVTSESVRERVECLDAGADDCLARPFQRSELLARLEALLRRATRRMPR